MKEIQLFFSGVQGQCFQWLQFYLGCGINEESDIILRVDGKYIDAYDTYENEFLAYLRKIEYPNNNFEVEVLLKENDKIKRIYSCIVESGE